MKSFCWKKPTDDHPTIKTIPPNLLISACRDCNAYNIFVVNYRIPSLETQDSRAEDYVYSSASDYAGNRGMLDIVVIF
jgi:hypothetical protein